MTRPKEVKEKFSVKYFNESGVTISKDVAGNLLKTGEKVGVQVLLVPINLDELIELHKHMNVFDFSNEEDESLIRDN